MREMAPIGEMAPTGEMAPGCENTTKYFLLASFFAPRCHLSGGCHLSDGCHLTHDYDTPEYSSVSHPSEEEACTYIIIVRIYNCCCVINRTSAAITKTIVNIRKIVFPENAGIDGREVAP